MNSDTLYIESNKFDYNKISEIHKLAFGGAEEADLTEKLLKDNSAQPVVSLVAHFGEKAVGHILFTKATINNNEYTPNIYILAPLAVKPDYQNQGIGAKLIIEGIDRLKHLSVDLVFVLGHPNYYPKFGFINNAKKLGFKPPFPIPNKDADAWMVKNLTALSNTVIDGQIICADSLNKEKYWRE